MHIANCDIYITDCNICQGVKRRSIRGLISSTEPQTSKYRLLKERTGGHQKSCRNTLTDGPRRAGKSPGDVLRFFGGRNLSDEDNTNASHSRCGSKRTEGEEIEILADTTMIREK